MRNQQPEAGGNRYQFRLHPASTTIDEEQQQQQQQQHSLPHQHQHQQQQKLCNSNNINNNNNNINIKSNDTSNKCVKAQMSASLTGGAGPLKELQRKQFTPTSDASNASFSSASVAGSIQDDMSDQCSLTQAGLEEYNIRSSSYYDQPVLFHHQKQSSYAQSEGYHSYVSSSDSSSATPFLDRLRQESEMLSRQSHHWSQNDLSSVSCASVAPSPTPLLLAMNGRDLGGGSPGSSSGDNNAGLAGGGGGGDTHHQQLQQQQQQQHNNSSESTSSTETLKWLGSMSDVSEASHATGYSAISESVSSSQLIVHSSRVLSPKRHHSESVLYLNNELQHASQPAAAALPCPLSDEQRVHHSHSLKHSHFPTPAAQDDRSPPAHAAAVRISPNHRHSPSYPPTHSAHGLAHNHPLHAYSAKKDSNVVGLPPSSLAVASSGHASSTSDLQPPQPQQPQQPKSSISVNVSGNEDPVVPPPTSEAATSGASVVVLSGFSASSSPSATTPLSVVTAGSGGASPTTTAPSSSSSGSSASSTSPLSGHSTASCRSNHRLFPVSTYTEPVHSNTSQYVQHPRPQFSAGLPKPAAKPKFASSCAQQPQQLPQTPPQPSWQSVAELIHDFERSTDQAPAAQTLMQAQSQTPGPGSASSMAPGQPQKFSYIEPSKTHRVSNPALKAFQKNAVQSYFERQQQQQHQQQQQQHSKELQQQQQQRLYQQQQQSLRPHSFQPPAAAKEPQLLRNSLPNSYAGPVATTPTSPAATPGYQQPMQAAAAPGVGHKPPSPAPPPPPPRSRSLMPTLLRRSSSASDYAEFRDQYVRASQEKLQAQSVKNISSSEKSSFNDCGMPPPPPPPRGRASLPVRRTSSASEYAAMRDKVLQQQAAALAQHRQRAPQQYYSPAPPPDHAAAPAMAQSWAPERPPKNPNLRVPSPDLPPPPSAEADASLSDEPLPPPPPEILHRPAQPYYDPHPAFSLGGELLAKPPSPSRRNSFAGSSTRKPPAALFGRSSSSSGAEQAPGTGAGSVPPLIPKKPTSIELLQLSRPASSLAAQCNKAHKVLLNGSGLPQPQQQQQALLHHQQQPQQHPPAPSKLSANRKRPHNPAAMLHIPPIMENPPPAPLLNAGPSPSPSKASPTSPPAATAPKSGPKPSPPPPLKPRMSVAGSQGPAASIGSKPSWIYIIFSSQKCNSKASYLPRQSLEKLNNTDPDHGSYKLTLTSNEDLVGHTKPGYDILAHNGKMPSNLPDVLPLGAKLQSQAQPQPSSPTSANGSPLRYSSNGNLSAASTPSPTQQPHAASCYPSMYPAQHRYSTPAMTSSKNYFNNNNNQATSYTRSQSYDVNSNSNTSASSASPTKFMSQSTVDLKKTHSLETTQEEASSDNAAMPSSAQSEMNLSSSAYSANNGSSITQSSNNISHSAPVTSPLKPLSPINRSMSMDERGDAAEGRIVRAELVNTTLPASPNINSKAITRKDSLRENIEKITQLQSQLMSAHLTDSGLLSSYGTKPVPNAQTATPEHDETKPSVPQSSPGVSTNNENNERQDCSENGAMEPSTPPALPKTPPPVADTECSEEVTVSQISQMDSNTDGLKLMQRSEIILRVNPTTVETASQTDDLPDGDMGRLTESHSHNKDDSQTRTTLQPRQRHPIELDCEVMARELAELLAPSDKLIEVLTPRTIKSPADYVSNLYNPNVPLRPTKRDVGTSTLMRMKARDSTHGEGEKHSVTVELQYAEIEVSLTNGNGPDSCDMLKKKVDELIKQLNRKLKILNREQVTIGEESAINDELGCGLVSKLADKVRPIEATKFRTYIDDVGHITSLLLSLSERLAKAENALSTFEEDNAEKKILESKRDRLLEQLEEAKRLKEDIDRRGSSVTGMLEKNLTEDEFADFDYFINMKAKLIADARDIADKIKCGEEQLCALSEALIQSDC